MGLMHALESLYARSPVPFQNLMVTARGHVLRRRRFGAEHDRVLRELLESKTWSREALDELRWRRLEETLRYAAERVPHYRELWSKLGIDVRDIRSMADFEQLPVTTKEELREAPERFVADGTLENAIKGHTSGSTGKPLLTFKDRRCYQHVWAFQARQRLIWGIDGTRPWISIRFPPVVPLDQSGPPFWRYNGAERQWLFSSFHLGDEHLPHYLEKISEIGPAEINGYPSAIYSVAAFALEKGFKGIRPLAVITVSETLLEEQRRVIEEAFACPVADQYGAAEICFWVGQCREGTYHTAPEFGLLETLDEEGRSVRGVEADVVGTGFVNRVQVLVRYRIGDRALLPLEPRPCACGWATDTVDKVIGRTDDVLVTPDGREVGRIDIVFKKTPGVKEAQVVQDAEDHLTVKLVPSGSDFERGRKESLAELQSIFGPAMRIDAERVDEIPRTASGKFRAQLNLVRRASGQSRREEPDRV